MNTTGIFSDIYACLADDVDVLPTLPEMTLTLRKELSDPNCTNKTAANLLKSNAGLVAFIMRVANSVRYMLREPPRDIESAVMRIGLATTKNLATTYATRSMFTPSTPELKKLLVSSYESATNIAVLSYLLAERLPGFDPDEAMLAGLMQDIALPPLLTRLAKRPEIFDDPEKMSQAIETLAPKVGVLMLEHWDFDKQIVDVVRSRGKWSRNESEELDMSDIILIARWYYLNETAETDTYPAFSDVPALQKLPPEELTEDKSLVLLEESGEEMGDIQKMLAA